MMDKGAKCTVPSIVSNRSGTDLEVYMMGSKAPYIAINQGNIDMWMIENVLDVYGNVCICMVCGGKGHKSKTAFRHERTKNSGEPTPPSRKNTNRRDMVRYLDDYFNGVNGHRGGADFKERVVGCPAAYFSDGKLCGFPGQEYAVRMANIIETRFRLGLPCLGDEELRVHCEMFALCQLEGKSLEPRKKWPKGGKKYWSLGFACYVCGEGGHRVRECEVLKRGRQPESALLMKAGGPSATNPLPDGQLMKMIDNSFHYLINVMHWDVTNAMMRNMAETYGLNMSVLTRELKGSGSNAEVHISALNPSQVREIIDLGPPLTDATIEKYHLQSRTTFKKLKKLEQGFEQNYEAYRAAGAPVPRHYGTSSTRRAGPSPKKDGDDDGDGGGEGDGETDRTQLALDFGDSDDDGDDSDDEEAARSRKEAKAGTKRKLDAERKKLEQQAAKKKKEEDRLKDSKSAAAAAHNAKDKAAGASHGKVRKRDSGDESDKESHTSYDLGDSDAEQDDGQPEGEVAEDGLPMDLIARIAAGQTKGNDSNSHGFRVTSECDETADPASSDCNNIGQLLDYLRPRLPMTVRADSTLLFTFMGKEYPAATLLPDVPLLGQDTDHSEVIMVVRAPAVAAAAAHEHDETGAARLDVDGNCTEPTLLQTMPGHKKTALMLKMAPLLTGGGILRAKDLKAMRKKFAMTDEQLLVVAKYMRQVQAHEEEPPSPDRNTRRGKKGESEDEDAVDNGVRMSAMEAERAKVKEKEEQERILKEKEKRLSAQLATREKEERTRKAAAKAQKEKEQEAAEEEQAKLRQEVEDLEEQAKLRQEQKEQRELAKNREEMEALNKRAAALGLLLEHDGTESTEQAGRREARALGRNAVAQARVTADAAEGMQAALDMDKAGSHAGRFITTGKPVTDSDGSRNMPHDGHWNRIEDSRRQLSDSMMRGDRGHTSSVRVRNVVTQLDGLWSGLEQARKLGDLVAHLRALNDALTTVSLEVHLAQDDARMTRTIAAGLQSGLDTLTSRQLQMISDNPRLSRRSASATTDQYADEDGDFTDFHARLVEQDRALGLKIDKLQTEMIDQRTMPRVDPILFEAQCIDEKTRIKELDARIDRCRERTTNHAERANARIDGVHKDTDERITNRLRRVRTDMQKAAEAAARKAVHAIVGSDSQLARNIAQADAKIHALRDLPSDIRRLRDELQVIERKVQDHGRVLDTPDSARGIQNQITNGLGLHRKLDKKVTKQIEHLTNTVTYQASVIDSIRSWMDGTACWNLYMHNRFVQMRSTADDFAAALGDAQVTQGLCNRMADMRVSQSASRVPDGEPVYEDRDPVMCVLCEQDISDGFGNRIAPNLLVVRAFTCGCERYMHKHCVAARIYGDGLNPLAATFHAHGPKYEPHETVSAQALGTNVMPATNKMKCTGCDNCFGIRDVGIVQFAPYNKDPEVDKHLKMRTFVIVMTEEGDGDDPDTFEKIYITDFPTHLRNYPTTARDRHPVPVPQAGGVVSDRWLQSVNGRDERPRDHSLYTAPAPTLATCGDMLPPSTATLSAANAAACDKFKRMAMKIGMLGGGDGQPVVEEGPRPSMGPPPGPPPTSATAGTLDEAPAPRSSPEPAHREREPLMTSASGHTEVDSEDEAAKEKEKDADKMKDDEQTGGHAMEEACSPPGAAAAFKIGQHVQMRDDDKAWRYGIVTSVQPLEVSTMKPGEQAQSHGYSWNEVRAIVGDEEKKTEELDDDDDDDDDDDEGEDGIVSKPLVSRSKGLTAIGTHKWAPKPVNRGDAIKMMLRALPRLRVHPEQVPGTRGRDNAGGEWHEVLVTGPLQKLESEAIAQCRRMVEFKEGDFKMSEAVKTTVWAEIGFAIELATLQSLWRNMTRLDMKKFHCSEPAECGVQDSDDPALWLHALVVYVNAMPKNCPHAMRADRKAHQDKDKDKLRPAASKRVSRATKPTGGDGQKRGAKRGSQTKRGGKRHQGAAAFDAGLGDDGDGDTTEDEADNDDGNDQGNEDGKDKDDATDGDKKEDDGDENKTNGDDDDDAA